MKPMKTMRLAALSLALLGGAEAALASVVTITAEFRPSSTNTQFKNTTPVSGFCNRWPSRPECTADNHSVALGIDYMKKTFRLAPDILDRLYVSLPRAVDFQVRNTASDETHALNFSVTNFSAYADGGTNELPSPAFTARVHGGCTWVVAMGNSPSATVLWRVNDPNNPTPCHSTSDWGPVGGEVNSSVRDFSVGYALTTPSPLAMHAGIYEGQIQFSVGSNGQPGDIGLGNGVSGSPPSNVTLNFVLDVQHALQVQFPANSDKVILEPPGGWMRWLNGGPAPEKLVRDLPFRITNSGPLSVFMECEHPVGRSCGIQNTRNNDLAALDIEVSLPGGIQLNNGQAVQRHPIPAGRGRPLHVEAVTPVFNQPGALHFATAPGEAAAMVANPGDTYRGNVTVVFDALL